MLRVIPGWRRKLKSLYSGHPIIITCVFGSYFNLLHPAPKGFQSIVFSNNPALEPEAKTKGWEFRLVQSQGMELSQDEKVSSIQSKYIKFLMFEEEFPDIFQGSPILYVDHKVLIDTEHVSKLEKIVSRKKAVLIRNTPRVKSTISEEVGDALGFRRYAESMPQTLIWVESMKRERAVSETVRIMNTGLIYYSQVPPLRDFLDEVYSVIKFLNQPECQIIWAVLSQAIEDLIQRVDWADIGIDHKLP
jgi:hypothetical protein